MFESTRNSTRRSARSAALSIITAGALLVSLAGCTDTGNEAAETEAMRSQRAEEFIARTNASLDALDRGIAGLDQELAATGDTTRTVALEHMVALRSQRDKLRQDLKKLEASTESVVEQQRAVLDDRLDQMEKELQIARLDAIREREEFEKALADRLADAEGTLNTLEQDVVALDSESDSTYAEVVARLEERHIAVAERISELRNAPAETFDQMRPVVTRSIVDLQHELNEALDGLHLQAEAVRSPATRERT